jgi:hypothetical protein
MLFDYDQIFTKKTPEEPLKFLENCSAHNGCNGKRAAKFGISDVKIGYLVDILREKQ